MKNEALSKRKAVLAAMLILAIAISFLVYLKNENAKKEDIGSNLYQYAPDFESWQLDGSRFALSDVKGRPIILNFWATWCPPCIREMPALQKAYEESDGEIMVIGVNMGEDEETIRKFLETKVNVSYPIVLDKNTAIVESYNVIIKPSTFFIDKDGMITDKKLGELSIREIREKTGLPE